MPVLDASGIRLRLSGLVKGQDHLLDDLVPFLVNRIAFPSARNPLTSLCFIGAPATGKTTLIRALSDCFYEDSRSCLRFDGEELYDVAATRSRIAGALLQNPRRVIAFENFERVSVPVQELLSGMLTQGQFADLSQAIVIFSTYDNYDETRIFQDSNSPEGIAAAVQTLSQRADESFIGSILQRVEKICVLRPLDDIAILQIATKMAIELGEDYGLELLEIEPEILDAVVMRSKNSVRRVRCEWTALLEDEFAKAKNAGWKTVRIISQEGHPALAPSERHS